MATKLEITNMPMQTDDVFAELAFEGGDMGWGIPYGIYQQTLPPVSNHILPDSPDSGYPLIRPLGDMPLPPADKTIDTAFDNPKPPPLATVGIVETLPSDEDVTGSLKKLPVWVWVLMIIFLLILMRK